MLQIVAIIPVPTKDAPSCLNDYRPVALTAVIMKVFERIVLAFINSFLPKSMDSGQYAYRENRSTDDAVNFTVHHVLQHLEQGKHNVKNYCRLHFIFCWPTGFYIEANGEQSRCCTDRFRLSIL